MYYSGNICFYNDGDYRVELDELKEKLAEWNIEKNVTFQISDDSHELSIDFRNLSSLQLRRICDVLIVSYRVGYLHSWVVELLYDFLNGISQWLLHNKEPDSYEDGLYDNYEGTGCYVIAHSTPLS